MTYQEKLLVLILMTRSIFVWPICLLAANSVKMRTEAVFNMAKEYSQVI